MRNRVLFSVCFTALMAGTCEADFWTPPPLGEFVRFADVIAVVESKGEESARISSGRYVRVVATKHYLARMSEFYMHSDGDYLYAADAHLVVGRLRKQDVCSGNLVGCDNFVAGSDVFAETKNYQTVFPVFYTEFFGEPTLLIRRDNIFQIGSAKGVKEVIKDFVFEWGDIYAIVSLSDVVQMVCGSFTEVEMKRCDSMLRLK